MSVSTIEAGVIRIGDGVTVEFSFSFEAISAADIKVSRIDGNSLTPITSGITTFLNLNGIGGTVTFDSAPADDVPYYIYRDTEATQLISVSKQTRYDPEVVENVWDKLTYLVQELEAETDRAVKTVPGADPAALLTSIDEAVVRSETAAVRAETAAGDLYDIRNFGAVSPGDIYAPMMAAIAAAPEGAKVIIPRGTWSCSVPVTFTGTKRVTLVKQGGAEFATPTDAVHAMPKAANFTTHLWDEVQVKESIIEGSGGAWLFSGRLSGGGADLGGQGDLIRVEMNANRSSSGPLYDGIGATNVMRHQVAASFFGLGTVGLMHQEIWGANAYVDAPAGSDAAAIGLEVNVGVNGQTAVKEVGGSKVKAGLYVVSKNDAATAGVVLGGLHFKGFWLNQAVLPADPASRAFEYKDLFEVMRDGRVLIGKGISDLYTAGSEVGPDGTVYTTASGVSAAMYGARSDNLAAATVAQILGVYAAAKDNAGTPIIYAQDLYGSLDGAAGSTDGYVNRVVKAAGGDVLVSQDRGTVRTVFVPLTITTTAGGVVFPRLTTAQRDAIVGVIDGTQIYNTTTNKFQGRAAGVWVDLH